MNGIARARRREVGLINRRFAPRDGAFIETIGTYNPKGTTAAEKIQVDAEKARQWIAQGATPSETVQSLLKQAGVFKPAAV